MSNNLEDIVDVMKAINKGLDSDDDGFRLLEDAPIASVSALSTGSIALDKALGVGGLPRSRVVEIYGPEASGKTTLTLNMIADVQRNGGRCAFLDMEHALDKQLAIGCGIDVSKLVFAQPRHGEQCFDMAIKLVESGKVDLLVIDSVAAMTPKKELEGEMEDANMGEQARMMGKGLRKLCNVVSRTKTIVIFINQLREKIGVMYGSNETTPGGKALKFFSSVRLDVRKKEPITSDGKSVIGNHVRVKVVKNKVCNPFTEADIDIIFGKGVDNTKDILAIGAELGIIAKSGGSWYEYNGVRNNGMAALRDYMIKNPTVMAEVDAKIRATLNKH